ncbi:MAG: 2-amino-4-hydroxy-6-hydroxymethyldihydropteridine diphosphokinase [Alphaproteobacteria bacterium]|nr:2-amino-4-hydroxy-6-hydroxymethyldihydropteridine diphosphokinase [Alphaproteobacteria bacterium]
MIFVALGANLPSTIGPPRTTLDAAVHSLAQEGGDIVARSRIYRSAPVPKSDQPEYLNAVVALKSALDPVALLDVLLRIEKRFGRVRREPNAARTLDLDLIADDDMVRDVPPILPHPRMHQRAFVLLPMAEIAPHWRHPRLGLGINALIDALPAALRAETRPAMTD